MSSETGDDEGVGERGWAGAEGELHDDVLAAMTVLSGVSAEGEVVHIADLALVRQGTPRPLWCVFRPSDDGREWVPTDYINPYGVASALDLAKACQNVSHQLTDNDEEDVDNGDGIHGGMFA